MTGPSAASDASRAAKACGDGSAGHSNIGDHRAQQRSQGRRRQFHVEPAAPAAETGTTATAAEAKPARKEKTVKWPELPPAPRIPAADCIAGGAQQGLGRDRGEAEVVRPDRELTPRLPYADSVVERPAEGPDAVARSAKNPVRPET